MTWDQTFTELFDRCLALYKGGNEDFSSYYTAEDRAFLGSIGYGEREFFDFIEDYADEGVPAPSTALLIAAARRDYFTVVQEGEVQNRNVGSGDVPARDATHSGMEYFPRIVAKAQAKLKGQLDPDLMFSCGGDRAFLAKVSKHPADFLRRVWASEGDLDELAAWLQG